MIDRFSPYADGQTLNHTSSRRMRVMFIDHTAVLSGGELAMLQILRAIDPSEMECAVILGSHGPLEQELASEVPVFIIPLNAWILDTRKHTLTSGNFSLPLRAISTIPYIWKLYRFLRKWKPDVVHTNSLKADVLGGIAARLAGIPVLWHIRDRVATDYLPAAAVRTVKLLCRIIPAAVVGCSQAVLDTLDLPPGKPQAVVYSGVMLSEFPLQPVAPSMQASSVTRIGLVGRLAPWKGQHIFLQAAASLRGEFPNLRFILLGSAMFGDQPYEKELRELVQREGLQDAVEFRGFVREINREILELDMVVHASTSPEPFGQTIVQGMAACKPVIAAAGGGASEIIRDGIDGLLVERDRPQLLAQAIARLLRNPAFARTLAMQGRQRVESMFTIEQTVASLQAALHQIVPGFGGPTRVLFYNATARVSGGEVVLLNILEKWQAADVSTTVCCPRGELSERMAEIGHQTLKVPELALRFTRNPLQLISYLGSMANAALTLRAAVRRGNPHIVHANSIRAGLVASLATTGMAVPVQWHVHDNLPPRTLSFVTRLAAVLSRRNRFLAVSRSTAQNLAGPLLPGILARRTSVLLNAVDVHTIVPQAGIRSLLRAELNLRDENFCVLHVGQIARRKNQLGAVRAFHAAFQSDPCARLLLVGAPVFAGGEQYLLEIEREIAVLGLEQRVRLLGHRHDVHRLMQASDIVLLNSQNDPCPLTILEAMAVSAPIVASRIDGIPELIDDDRTGWLAEAGDERDFARRMRQVAALSPQTRAAVGAAARSAVEPRSLEHYVSEFARITGEHLRSVTVRRQPLEPEAVLPPIVRNSDTIPL